MDLQKRLIAVIITSLFSLSQAAAQVPGYMGKRAVVGYGFYFHPAISSTLMNYGGHPISTLHDFFLEYTTSKKFALGASLRLFRFTNNNVEAVDANRGSNSSTFRQFSDNPEGTYLIKGKNIQLYGKFYKSGYLAPWGKYFALGLAINLYQAYYDPYEMRVLVQQQGNGVVTRKYIRDFGTPTQTFSQVDVFFGNGNSRIFANRIVLDYGYTINLLAMTKSLLRSLDGYEDYYPEEYIEKTSASRVNSINKFNFYVKLGYLF